MDANDILNIQEAYTEVYNQLDEVRGGGRIDPVSDFPHHGERGSRSPRDAGLKMSPIDRAEARANALRKRENPEATKRANRIQSRFVGPTKRGLGRAINASNVARASEKKRLMQREEVNNYILSHLLDEGYAETIESAETIMVNMGEEWLCDILDEAKVDWHNRDQSNVDDRVKVLRDRNRRNVSGVPDGYQTAVRRTKHDVSRGKKKQKGLKTTSDNLGKMGRGPYRKQQYKRTGNDLYKD